MAFYLYLTAFGVAGNILGKIDYPHLILRDEPK